MSISERIVAVALLAVALPLAALAADRSAVVMPVAGKPFFVQLEPIFIPVIGKDRVSRQVSVAVAVEIADGGKAPDVEARRRTLNDAFLSDLYVYVQQRGGIGSPNGETALKERLRETASRVLDPVKVNEVEIEEFFERAK